MSWRWLTKTVTAVISTALLASVTAWVTAKLTGTPLNGVPGILQFWKRMFIHAVPVWVAGILVIVAAALTVLWAVRQRARSRRKVDLRIVVLPTPPPRWSIGAVANVPVMFLHFHARLAHARERSLEIVKGYLEGTQCAAAFPSVVVTGPFDQSQMVHFGVRPIAARPGKALSGRVILVDQFGDRHRSEKITFQPAPEPVRSGQPSSTVTCFFCRGAVAVEDRWDTSVGPVHKACVR